MSEANIYCFGDSITWGESDHIGGGWADRLKVFYIQRSLETGGEGICVFNLGIGGETTQGVQQRFEAELRARLNSTAQSVVLLAYGANDAAEINGSCIVPIETYQERLRYCVAEAKKIDTEILILNITPIALSVDGVPNTRGTIRRTGNIEKYNDSIRHLAQQEKIALLDVHAELLRHNGTSLFVEDGVHLNAAGHEVIYQLIKHQLMLCLGKSRRGQTIPLQ